MLLNVDGDTGCNLVTAFHTMSVIIPSPSIHHLHPPNYLHLLLLLLQHLAAADLCIVYYTGCYISRNAKSVWTGEASQQWLSADKWYSEMWSDSIIAQ